MLTNTYIHRLKTNIASFLSLAEQLLYIESVSGEWSNKNSLIHFQAMLYVVIHKHDKLMLMLCLLEIPEAPCPSRVLAQIHGVNALVLWLTAFHTHPFLERLYVK